MVMSLVLGVVGWVLGVSLQMQAPQLWEPGRAKTALGFSVVAVLAGLLGLVRGRRPMVRAASGFLMLGAGALLGYAQLDLRSGERLAERLPHALEGVPLMVEGQVLELPRRSARGVQFVFAVEAASTLEGEPVRGVPPRLWLGWWLEGPVEAALAAPVPEPVPGDRWRLPVVLKRPHGTLNPHAFDAERWFLEHQLGASGHVAAAHRAQAQRLGASSWQALMPEYWRSGLRMRIDRAVQDPQTAGFVAGLTIGDQSSVEAEDWALFRDTGLAHVLSISGLHITIFASLAAPAAAWLWRRWPAACLRWPAPLAGAWIGWLCAGAYALLAGWGLPAQRTVAMLGVATALRCAGLQWPALLVWLVAAAPVVLFDPWAIGQAGFWLSFAAVGLLLVMGALGPASFPPPPDEGAGTVRSGRLEALMRLLFGLWQHARTQLLVTAGLAPLVAVCFQQVSVVGLLANLVAVPWLTLVVTPVCMLGLLEPGLWAALPLLLEPLRALLRELASWPGAVLNVPSSEAPWLAAALLGAALTLAPLPLRLRVGGALLIVPLLVPPPHNLSEGVMEVWGLDVGQGSAVLVRTRRHALLVDAGPAQSGAFDAGERVVLPVLRGLGVRSLDLLVLTHRDIDHAGGAAAVLRGMEVRGLLSSLEPSHPLRRVGVPHQSCLRGQSWTWDGVRFEVLHPLAYPPFNPQRRLKANTISCVLRIEDAAGRSILVTGDIEAEQEAALVAARPSGLRSEALVVPHHGSRTSSTAAFLDAVAPQWALVQAGHRNRHGHPAAEVMTRLEARGIEIHTSPWCGAWRWSGEAPQCWRATAPRHWHERPP